MGKERNAKTMLEKALIRRNRATFAAALLAFVFTYNMQFAAAAGGLFDQLGGTFDTLRISLIGMAPMVAGAAYVIAKIWQMATPEKQGRAEPREWARSALVNYVAILIAWGLVTFLKNTFSGVTG